MLLPITRELDLAAIAGGVNEGDYCGFGDSDASCVQPAKQADATTVPAESETATVVPAPETSTQAVKPAPAVMTEDELRNMMFRATIKNMLPKGRERGLLHHEAQRQAAEWGVRKVIALVTDLTRRAELIAYAQSIMDFADEFLPYVFLFRDAKRKNLERGTHMLEAYGPASLWALRELNRDPHMNARDRKRSAELIEAERPYLTPASAKLMLAESVNVKKTAGIMIDFMVSDERLYSQDRSKIRDVIADAVGSIDAKRVRKQPGFTSDEVTEAYRQADKWVDDKLNPPVQRPRHRPTNGNQRFFRSLDAALESTGPRDHASKETAPAVALTPEEEAKRSAERQAERQRRAEASAAASRSLTKAMMETPGESRRRAKEKARSKAAKEGGKKKAKRGKAA